MMVQAFFDWLGNVFVQICSKRTVRQMEEFAIFVNFVNFGCHNNYFRPGTPTFIRNVLV